MASSLLYPATMGTPTDGPPAGDSSTSDLGAFNRWLCLTRLRAAAAVAAFATAIAPLNRDGFRSDVIPLAGVEATL